MVGRLVSKFEIAFSLPPNSKDIHNTFMSKLNSWSTYHFFDFSLGKMLCNISQPGDDNIFVLILVMAEQISYLWSIFISNFVMIPKC